MSAVAPESLPQPAPRPPRPAPDGHRALDGISGPDVPPTPDKDPADYSISMLRANLAGFPLFLVMMTALVLPYLLSRGLPAFILGVNRFVDLKVFLPWIAAGTVAHELLHGLGWMVAGNQPFRSVRFGFHWKTLTPYTHFTEPITASAYRIGIVLPGFVVGIAPTVVGYVIDHPAFVLFGGIFFGAAAGDALGLWAVRKIPAQALVLDHPSRVGCRVVSSPEIRLSSSAIAGRNTDHAE